MSLPLVRLLTATFLFAALLLPTGSHAAINLGGGVGGIGGIGQTGTFDPGGGLGGGGGFTFTVSQLESDGYACAPGHFATTECKLCWAEIDGVSQDCEIRYCGTDQTCNDAKRRYYVPAEVDPARYGVWAREFALGASSYWLADFDGDGRLDLAAQWGSQVKVALSRGDYFQDVGFWNGSVPPGNGGPNASVDVNGDGNVDTLSVSGAGHLLVGISNGSGVIGQVDMPNVFCAGRGTCLIGDVDGDGHPDLVEVMTGAIDTDRAGDVWVSLGSAVPGFPTLPAPPAAVDTDGDGIADRDDNCIETPNASQLDSDGDGYGNACDADLDQDGTVGHSDLEAWVACFLKASEPMTPECAAADFDGDGVVTLADYHQVLIPTTGGPPGPSEIDTAPVITLAAPIDGTILNASTTQAWVAGWVANVPAGSVALTVNGAPVAPTGPDNFFSTFVSMASIAGDPDLFHPVVVEATRGDMKAVERRVVLAGNAVRPGFRAHGALGARLSAEGLARVQEYLQTKVAHDIQVDMPKQVDGVRYIADCSAYVPICWSSITISNTTVSEPVITVEFQGDTIHAHAFIQSLHFDWEVEVDGPNCGDDTTVSNIDIDLQYRISVGVDGEIEVHEVHEPVINDSINVDGCWGAGHGALEDGVQGALRGFVNDPDDVEGTNLQGPQMGAPEQAIYDVFQKLDVSGSIDFSYGGIVADPGGVATTANFAARLIDPFGESHYTIDYDSRFESASQDSTGITVWMGAGVDVEDPPAGYGSPDGAFQIPFASTPTLPATLPSGSAYHVAAAITPNGLNEALDAVARTGFLQTQGLAMTETKIGAATVKFTAGVLKFMIPEFASYPPAEKFTVFVTPSKLAPVVSGWPGPNGEALDVQLAQTDVSFVDQSGAVALALKVDARIGVDVGLDTTGSGALTGTARHVQIMGMALTENPIGADPAVVFQKLLCVGVDDLTTPFACAIADELSNGLDKVIGTLPLPSLRDKAHPDDGFGLAPKCLVRLTDGTLVGEFGLLLPGEPAPTTGHAGVAALNFDCMPPITATTGVGTTGGTTVGGGLGGIGTGTVVVGGVLAGGTAAAPVTTVPGPTAPVVAAPTTSAPVSAAPTAIRTATETPIRVAP
jgi:hypothetical protein